MNPSPVDELARKTPAAASGLTEAEAAARLLSSGKNLVPSEVEQRTWIARILETLRQPLILLLLLAAAVYVALGDPLEAFALGIGILFIIAITVLQQIRSDNALLALRRMAAPVATVIRDGIARRVKAEEVVTGDLLLLEEGDRVPADAVLLSGPWLSLNESHLTGESVSVTRSPTPAVSLTEPNRATIFAASLVVQGHGSARVVATGASTAVGQIARMVQTITLQPTKLQRDTTQLLRWLAIGAVAICIIIFFLYGMRFGWMQGLLAGITAGIAIIPEEFPIVIMLFVALGAWRIAQHRVLTRQLSAVERLGAATVLCVDKTGTLTENRMEIASIVPLPASRRTHGQVLEAALFASRIETSDPLDRSLLAYAVGAAPDAVARRRGAALLREFPPSSTQPAYGARWGNASAGAGHFAVKGAAEFLLPYCSLQANEQTEILREITTLASNGYRILGIAERSASDAHDSSDPFAHPLEFLGFVAWSDPVRPSVPAAVHRCHQAGIRIMMVTGDFLPTATAVATRCGMSLQHTLTGAEMDELDEHTLRFRLQMADIVARVRPDQKLRLVRALQANGDVVAMTGDGVNDAPALKAADIGIALGKHGTEVAREAAHLVLLEDDFSTLVGAIRLGRRTFDNLRQALTYLTAIHVPIVGVALLPALAGWPMILTPLQVAFLELIIDPACSIAFEAEPANLRIMERPPRPPGSSIFHPGRVISAVFQGLLMFAGLLMIMLLWPHTQNDVRHIRTMIWLAFVVGNLSLIWVNRDWGTSLWQSIFIPNHPLWVITTVVLIALSLIYMVPSVASIFEMATVSTHDILAAIAIGAGSVLWIELLKPMRDYSLPL